MYVIGLVTFWRYYSPPWRQSVAYRALRSAAYSKSNWFLNLFIGKETNSCNNLAYIPAEFTNLEPNIKFRWYNDICYYSRTHKSSILNAFCY